MSDSIVLFLLLMVEIAYMPFGYAASLLRGHGVKLPHYRVRDAFRMLMESLGA